MKNVSLKAYVGRYTIRHADEPKHEKDVHGTLEEYAKVYPKAVPHVFATYEGSVYDLFLEQKFGPTGSGGVIVKYRGWTRGDVNQPDGSSPYSVRQVEKWREGFRPELLGEKKNWHGVTDEVWEAVTREVDPEPFVIVDCNRPGLDVPMTDEDYILAALSAEETGPRALVDMALAASGVDRDTKIEDYPDMLRVHLATAGKMIVG